jgi:hypothetical protein
MTGKTSRRQWMPWRVRTLLAVILTLGMLIPGVSAYAQSEGTPVDKICVEGSVINFDETPLGEDYTWTITYGPKDSGETFTVTTDEDGKFKLESGEGSPLNVGVWTFSINPLPSPSTDGPWEGITSLTFDVPLAYGNNSCVQVRWKMVRYVPVIVTKIDDLHNLLDDWVIRAEPVRGNWFAYAQELTTGEFNQGEAIFRLTEGQWNFKERAPHGVRYTPILPSSGQQTLNVEWQGLDEQGNPIPQVLRFKNRVTEHGCIDVFKSDVFEESSTPLPGWKMTVKRANGTTVATGYTDASGKVSFENLPFGPYTVYEELRNGWAPASPTGITVDVTNASECARVEFFNEQDFGFSFTGRKLDANGHVGLPDWKITIKALDKGGAMPTNALEDEDGNYYVLTDGLGNYRFDFPSNDYRVPGARYQICEEMKSGWLPHTSTCYNVRLPHQPGSPVNVWDFVNQQVGHSESMRYGSHTGSSGSCRYTVTVVPGDSLYGIGASYGVSASAMLAANPWVYNRPHYFVRPGDTVCVP